MKEGILNSMVCFAAGSPGLSSAFAATLASALAGASSQNVTAAAGVIAAAASRKYPFKDLGN